MAMDYDSWLVAPMERMMAENDAFVDFCEREGIDPDAPDADDKWQEYLASIEPDEPDYDDEPPYDWEP